MQPGDLVVCVNTGPISGAMNRDLNRLRNGDIYTIEDTFCVPPNGLGLTLIEVPISDGYAWLAERFRPCRRTDISAIAAGVKEREMVDG
jgi:hypothetical protein